MRLFASYLDINLLDKIVLYTYSAHIKAFDTQEKKKTPIIDIGILANVL